MSRDAIGTTQYSVKVQRGADRDLHTLSAQFTVPPGVIERAAAEATKAIAAVRARLADVLTGGLPAKFVRLAERYQQARGQPDALRTQIEAARRDLERAIDAGQPEDPLVQRLAGLQVELARAEALAAATERAWTENVAGSSAALRGTIDELLLAAIGALPTQSPIELSPAAGDVLVQWLKCQRVLHGLSLLRSNLSDQRDENLSDWARGVASGEVGC